MKKFLAIFLAVAMLALACVATVSAEEKVNVMFYDPAQYLDPATGEIDYAAWKQEVQLTSGVANTKGCNWNYDLSYIKNYGYYLGQQFLNDGELSADPDLNPNYLEFRINNVYAGYDADGNKNKGDYVAWWGYKFVKPVTCDSFEVYFRDDGGIAGLAILAGTLNADGTITWTEVAREAALNAAGKTTQYDALTKCWAGNFTAPATMDFVRVAYLAGSQTYTFFSEFKMFAVGGAAPAETTAAPVETTAAPVETTAAPVETTAAPVETTAAPVDTTAAPVDTTAAPVVTTAAPVVTTAPTQTPDTADVSMIVVMVAALALTAVVVLRRRVRD